jgi:hypothetical protein
VLYVRLQIVLIVTIALLSNFRLLCHGLLEEQKGCFRTCWQYSMSSKAEAVPGQWSCLVSS